jgi:hypothetical protein
MSLKINPILPKHQPSTNYKPKITSKVADKTKQKEQAIKHLAVRFNGNDETKPAKKTVGDFYQKVLQEQPLNEKDRDNKIKILINLSKNATLEDYRLATDKAILQKAGYSMLDKDEVETARGLMGLKDNFSLENLKDLDKSNKLFVKTNQRIIEKAKIAGQAVLQFREYESKLKDTNKAEGESKTNQMLLDPIRLGFNTPVNWLERTLNIPRDLLQQADKAELTPFSSEAKYFGKIIAEKIVGKELPEMPTFSQNVKDLTGIELPSIPEVKLPRPFEYQTEKYKREAKTGEDLGATAIDLFLLKRGIFGKPSATPQSLKTLGGLPEVEALNTVKNVAKTEVITPKVVEPRVSQPLRARPSETVPSSKQPIGSIGTPEKVPNNLKTIDEKLFARSIKRQNEAAEVMSKNGYHVEYQPKITEADRMSRFPWFKKERNPDFKIEGEIFDGYAPNKDTGIKSLLRGIKDKTEKNQARRILLNLDDSNVSVTELAKELRLSKLPYLDEVIVVKGGKITKVYPYNQAK